MNTKTNMTIIVALMLMLPLSLTAQSGAYFGPHLGIQKSQDAEDANYLGGATLRLKLAPVLAIEGDIGYRQAKFGSNALTVRDWPITATGLLYPLPIIYGGVGAGWYNTTFDYSDAYNDIGIDDETSQEFGWHLVAGLEIPASPTVRIFGDVRYVFLDYEFKELPDAVLEGAESDFYSINLGLLFQF